MRVSRLLNLLLTLRDERSSITCVSRPLSFKFCSCLKIDKKKSDNTNVLGVFNTAQTAARHWISEGFREGSIVIVSSMSSQIYNMAGGICQPLTHVSLQTLRFCATASQLGIALGVL